MKESFLRGILLCLFFTLQCVLDANCQNGLQYFILKGESKVVFVHNESLFEVNLVESSFEKTSIDYFKDNSSLGPIGTLYCEGETAFSVCKSFNRFSRFDYVNDLFVSQIWKKQLDATSDSPIGRFSLPSSEISGYAQIFLSKESNEVFAFVASDSTIVKYQLNLLDSNMPLEIEPLRHQDISVAVTKENPAPKNIRTGFYLDGKLVSYVDKKKVIANADEFRATYDKASNESLQMRRIDEWTGDFSHVTWINAGLAVNKRGSKLNFYDDEFRLISSTSIPKNQYFVVVKNDNDFKVIVKSISKQLFSINNTHNLSAYLKAYLELEY